jgi:opacity protein-like surface antigen
MATRWIMKRMSARAEGRTASRQRVHGLGRGAPRSDRDTASGTSSSWRAAVSMKRMASASLWAGSVATAAVLCALAGAVPLSAQGRTQGLHLGGGWVGGLLVGDASDFLDGGSGPWISLEWRGERRASLGATVTAEWVRLADDTDELTGARARNSLLSVSAGPTLGVWLGPARPWVGGFAGVTLSRWSTEWSGQRGRGSASAFAWGAGAGLQVRLTAGNHPVSIGGEARLTDTGTLSFARAPAFDPPPAPTGLISRDVALLSLRVGVSVTLGRRVQTRAET